MLSTKNDRLSTLRQPTVSKLIYVCLGILCVLLFTLQKYTIIFPDFTAARYTPDGFILVQYFAILFSLYFLILSILAQCIEYPAQKTCLAFLCIFFALASIAAFFTLPTRSADIYWNLLLVRGFTHYGLNPYVTTPNNLSMDGWFSAVPDWRDVSIHLGPLWVLLLSIVTYLNASLSTALSILKFLCLMLLLASGWLTWQILKNEESISQQKRLAIMTLLSWNPLVLQLALVDLHSDVLILFSIVLAYRLYQKNMYRGCALVLTIAGFIKYTPWLLLPLPLYALVSSNDYKKWSKDLAIIAATFLCSIGISYFFFGAAIFSSSGLVDTTLLGGSIAYSLPGTFFLHQTLGLNFILIRILGMVGAMILLAFYRVNPEKAFSFPILFIFIFAAPWFFPWYLLWIYPLIFLSLPMKFAILSTVLGILTPEVLLPLELSMSFLILIILYLLAQRTVAKTNALS